MTELTRCPGNELNKNLQVINIECQECGKDNEIFGDELNKTQTCTKCSSELDISSVQGQLNV